MWEMQILVHGDWVSLRPPMPAGAPPYRYAFKADAERCLEGMFPLLPPEHKRVFNAMGCPCES